MNPVGDIVAIEPILVQEVWAASIRKAGLVAPKPDFQGAPFMGYVRAIAPKIEDPEIAIGDVVIFKEDHPKGIDYKGKTIFPISYDKIQAKYEGDMRFITNTEGAK
jgi:hypothetical protein